MSTLADKSISSDLAIEIIPINDLSPHPRNYQQHPEDQLQHLIESIHEHGLYRPVVIARDNTILAGHGLVLAATELGYQSVPVIRLPLAPEDPRALKVLTGDNELGHLAERDDRLLSELLKEIKDVDLAGLLGTGYDEMMLANLVFVTRPESEIRDFDEAGQWVGMPEYDNDPALKCKLLISFRSAEDRERFIETSHLQIDKRQQDVWTTRWPWTDREDTASLRFAG